MHLEDYTCALCHSQTEETWQHLFLFCPLTQACWLSLGFILPNDDNIFNLLEHLRTQLQVRFFMEIIVTILWSIWEIRNDAIFTNIEPTVQSFRRIFKREFAWVILRAKASYQPSISQWIEVHVYFFSSSL
jgi:hypothetical protein